VRDSLGAVTNISVNEGVISLGPPRAGDLWVGINLFRLLRRNIAFALTRIALVVLTFARRTLTCVFCLVTFPSSGLLASVLGLVALVPPLSFVLEVAVWAERQA
jgi:hypothetical protein